MSGGTDDVSTTTGAVRAGNARRAHRPLQDWPLVAGLVLLWLLMWGSFSPITIVTGIVTAVLVVRVFELPAVLLSGRFNVLWFLVFLGRFVVDLVVASVTVAAQAFAALDPRRVPRSALVAVHLRVHDDFLLTLTSITLSLIPGSIVVEVNRDDSVLYLHVLGAKGPEDADRTRDQVHAIERRLVRAMGSKEEWEAMR